MNRTLSGHLSDAPGAVAEGSDSGDLSFFERLDQVPGLQILEVAEADAAFEALADFAGIFLEPLQGVDAALPDDGTVTQEANLRATTDLSAAHVATGDGTHARHPEDLAHFGLARDDLFELGGQHADHGLLDVLEQFV